MHTVIIGGGFAGVKAALELSKKNIGNITLVSDEDHFLHHATLYATATGKSMAESVVPLKELFAGNERVNVVKDSLITIDAKRKLAVGKKTDYHYDNLIIAIGSVTNYFGIDGVQKHAYGIRTLNEVKEFNQHIKHEIITDKHLDKNYVIVGGGPTGIELAGALVSYLERLAIVHEVSRAKVRVTLVEAGPRILPRMSNTASKIVSRRLKALGVEVKVNQAVEALTKDTVSISGKKVPSETVVWTSGVANHPFFKALPDYFTLAPNGRVEVDQHLQAYKNIYVLGDNNTAKYSGMAWPALAQAEFIANHFARIARKRPTAAFRPSLPPSGIPVGENWAYVEWHGVYAAGRTGHLIRRRMELYGYKQLLPRDVAVAAWRAHDIPQIEA